jgi:branched-chain amino acid transport system permease protein
MIAASRAIEVSASGLSSGAVYGLLALGLVLIYRTTGAMNFAHWAIGLLAVIAYLFFANFGVPVVLAMFLALAVSPIAGIAAYRLVFQRVPRANYIVTILVTIGVAQLFASMAAMVLGFKPFTRLPPWLPEDQVHFAGTLLNTSDLVTIAVAVAVAGGFLAWFRLTRAGRALRAVAQNREAALLAGIDDVRSCSIAWGIGSTLAALALLLVLPHVAGKQGGLITTFDITPFGTLLIPAFGAALVGGLVNLPMALAGGFGFGLVREWLVLAPKPWSDLRAMFAALLILLLLVMHTERFFVTAQEREALET